MSLDDSARRPSDGASSFNGNAPAATAGTASAGPRRTWHATELPAWLRDRLAQLFERAGDSSRWRRHRRQGGFHWHEREWGSRLWSRRLGLAPRTLVTIATAVVISLFVFVIAARAATRATLPTGTGATQITNPIIIQHQSSNNPASPQPTYTVGVWVSSMSPAAAGAIQVYVRVTSNTPLSNQPVKLASVQVSASAGTAFAAGGHQVSRTDRNGLASFTLFYGSTPGSPIYVTATATIDGHQYSSTTVFVAG